MSKKYYYITTPLYYVNDRPHIGHAYTTIAADILARHKKAKDIEVFFQTGTDEHGSNIEKIAREKNDQPKKWADLISEEFKRMWKRLNINYDNFIRTTDKEHERKVQEIFENMIKNGDIYLGTYEGLYCLPCENFFDESELSDGNCPVHHRKVEKVSEESYFFKLSGYQNKLLRHYQDNPDFLSPSYRASEIINFAKSGLRDISVSRTKVSWGIPVISNPKHTIYVWFDALLNYITGAGYRNRSDGNAASCGGKPDFNEIWPADVHFVGKEIYRFHAVIWPAMLMSLGLPLPKKVFAHGWWTFNGERMSKTRGNVINPEDVAKEYGADALRYFIFREVPFGQDGDFSSKSLQRRYNSDLANDLGNLFSRVLNMVNKYLEYKFPAKPENAAIFEKFAAITPELDSKIENMQFSEALDKIWQAISVLNKEIDVKKPWEMAKKNPEQLKPFLFDLIWCLRLIANWIYPFMPNTATKMQIQLGISKTDAPGIEIQKSLQLFPRKL